jgi:acetaldehyde dehydrogenase / alcohol dehydrogenase
MEERLVDGAIVATAGVSEERRAELDKIVGRAVTAANSFRALDQEAVDRIVWAMVVAGLQSAVDLAGVAIEETGFGVFEDKVIKNLVATEFLYDYLKDKKTVGVIDEDLQRGVQLVAEPMGVVMAITPVTNPTSTVLFKAIVAAKTRNAIIFRPSPHAVRSAEQAAGVLSEAGERAGMPAGAIQVIPDVAHEVTHYLFRHPGIDFLWTTGGRKIVELTNSAGKPCVSVGPGNAPVYLHRTADIKMAVVDILISKTFDSSVICPAEQTLVVDDAICDELLAEFVRMGASVLSAADVDRLAKFTFPACGGPVNMAAVGQSATELAARAGISVPSETKVLLAPLPSDLLELGEHPLVREKLMPVLGVVRARDEQHGIDACVLVTEHGGLGHTSAIYARDEGVVSRYSLALRTGRILVNAPTAMGVLGGIYNSLVPTLSLGCGTWGGSATTDNVNYRNLLNIKTVARRVAPSQWFRVPSEIYFNVGALDNLDQMKPRQVVIVTDALCEQRGVVEEIRRRLGGAKVRVFAEVVPEPDESVVRAGVEVLNLLQPDLIVALGGGSVIDAAKTMRLIYEHPSVSLEDLSLPFLDARKRVAVYPPPGHIVRLVAIPTTSGTGSEVSPGAVITSGRRKITLVDYSLLPEVAIVDPALTASMPPFLTADSGIDALTHAIEAIVSIFGSPYTDSLCIQATRLIFDALPRAYADGTDMEARTAMANAATIAGMAMSNAFVGVNHSLAHAVGACFKVPHGRANGIFLPHVIRYNASLPTKFMPAPGYSAYVAPQKYAMLGGALFGGESEEEQVGRLLHHVEGLLDELGMPRTLKETGIPEDDFEAALPELAKLAFDDPTLRTNPRMPLLTEILGLLKAAYHG